MIRSLVKLLPWQQCCVQRQLTPALVRQFSEVEVELDDPKTLKKFIGLTDALGEYANARERLTDALKGLLDAVQALPADAGYRQAVEATANYRLKVLSENPADQAVEEVLNAHMEELIVETTEELKLIPVVSDFKAWDVPPEHSAPIIEYQDAALLLGHKK